MQGDKRDSWMVLLLEDVREAAQRQGMGASVEALGVAIAALRLESGERWSEAEARAVLEGDAGKHRH